MDGTEGTSLPESKRWLGIGVRILTTLFFLLLLLTLNRCDRPRWPGSPAASTTPAGGNGFGTLRVEVRPEGASVRVDGLRSGVTPLLLDLPPGQHTVGVEMDGYEPLEQVLQIAAGKEAQIGGQLVPAPGTLDREPSPGTSAPTAVTATGEPLPDLTVQNVLIELETGGACDYASTRLGVSLVVENTGNAAAGEFIVEVNGSQQTVKAGLAPGETVVLWYEGYSRDGENRVAIDPTSQVTESKEDNNSFAQPLPIPTLPPTCTPPPTPSSYRGQPLG